MRCTSSYTRAACASLADSYGPGAPRGATLSGYNIYPAAPELTEAQRQGSLATGLPLCWGHEADTVHIHESELGAHDHLQTTCLGCVFTATALRFRRRRLRSNGHVRCLPRRRPGSLLGDHSRCNSHDHCWESGLHSSKVRAMIVHRPAATWSTARHSAGSWPTAASWTRRRILPRLVSITRTSAMAPG